MAVSIPGVLLSSLMFEMKNSTGDMVGILLGSTLSYNVSTISDSESCGTREERKIYIQEYVVAGTGVSRFTDKRRKVDFSKLEDLIERKLESIVGWFRYRCNSSHNLSIVEKTVHRQLMQGLPHAPGRDLVFGLFTEQTPEDPGLHTMEHSFSHWIGSAPQLIHVDVVNLKSTSTMPYRLFPTAPVPTSLNTFYDLVHPDRQNDLLTESGEAVHAVAMNKLFEEFQDKFTPLQDSIRESFGTIQSLENDIDQIKKQIFELKVANETKEFTIDNNNSTTSTDNIPPLISFNDDDSLPSLPTSVTSQPASCHDNDRNDTLLNTDPLLLNGMKQPLVPEKQLTYGAGDSPTLISVDGPMPN